MRHGMGGGGMGEHNQNPVHATVGTLTAGLTFLALWHLVRMPFVRPKMFMRTLLCALLMVPFTIAAGEYPITHTWWDLLIFMCAGWISEAREEGET